MREKDLLQFILCLLILFDIPEQLFYNYYLTLQN